MSAMAKKKRTAGRGVQFYTDDHTADALEAYIESRPPDERPTKRSVLEVALRAYLQGKGFWPPRPGKKSS